MYIMENGNDSNVWYIPQGVSFEIITSILAYCFNTQKKKQPITKDSIKKIIPKSEKTVRNAVKMLENIGIFKLNEENDTYHLDEISMSFAEKLATKEDVQKEANEIIEKSYLSDIFQIILSNEGITKPKLVEKMLINSTAGNVKDHTPYMTTIHCILDILNLSGKISKERFTELRGNPEQTSKNKTTPSVARSRKRENVKKEITPSSLEPGIHGIVKTTSIEVKIRNVGDLEFARMVLDKLQNELSDSNNNSPEEQTAQQLQE